MEQKNMRKRGRKGSPAVENSDGRLEGKRDVAKTPVEHFL